MQIDSPVKPAQTPASIHSGSIRVQLRLKGIPTDRGSPLKKEQIAAGIQNPERLHLKRDKKLRIHMGNGVSSRWDAPIK